MIAINVVDDGGLEAVDTYGSVAEALEMLLDGWLEDAEEPVTYVLIDDVSGQVVTTLMSCATDPTIALVTKDDGTMERYRVAYEVDSEGCYIRSIITRLDAEIGKPYTREDTDWAAANLNRDATEYDVEESFWPWRDEAEYNRWLASIEPCTDELMARDRSDYGFGHAA